MYVIAHSNDGYGCWCGVLSRILDMWNMKEGEKTDEECSPLPYVNMNIFDVNNQQAVNLYELQTEMNISLISSFSTVILN
uniref:Uncharacterized protein n=1 Tax=Caenorhabditis tropicalis TaxID=1561998 RepID=A0A1I7UB63_9PELO